MRHVIWDWNGTLLDDFALNVAAVNECCSALGGPAVTADEYRTHFTRPITVFYERLLGRPLADGEWTSIDRLYHDCYRRGLVGAALTPGAEDALALVADTGLTQSLLSMWEHDELVGLVEGFDLARRFVQIDGQRTHGWGGKLDHLVAHLETLDSSLGPLARDQVVMVGDTLDDADAAARLGVKCVLVEHGLHHGSDLRAAGHAVAPTVLEALAAAGLPG